jgi:hypothetical protein
LRVERNKVDGHLRRQWLWVERHAFNRRVRRQPLRIECDEVDRRVRRALMSLIMTFMFEPAKLQMNWARASGISTLRSAVDRSPVLSP